MYTPGSFPPMMYSAGGKNRLGQRQSRAERKFTWRLNIAANRVCVEVRRFDIRSRPLAPIAEDGDRASSTVVVANLLLPLLLELARQMAFTPPHLLAGGLLREQAAEVADAFGLGHGMRVQATLEQGEWAALWLVLDE